MSASSSAWRARCRSASREATDFFDDDDDEEDETDEDANEDGDDADDGEDEEEDEEEGEVEVNGFLAATAGEAAEIMDGFFNSFSISCDMDSESMQSEIQTNHLDEMKKCANHRERKACRKISGRTGFAFEEVALGCHLITRLDGS